MTNKVTKYGLMTIAAVLLVAMAFAGAASAENVAPESFEGTIQVNGSLNGGWPTLDKSVSVTDGYYIKNESNWRYVVESVNTGETTYTSANIILTNDIVFTSEVPSLGNSTAKKFQGHIYGNGYKIVNFTQSGAEAHGLIYCAGEGCILNYVQMIDSNISTSNYDVGGLVGYPYHASTNGIQLCGCSVSFSNVTTGGGAGGLVGDVCYSKLWVNASWVDHAYVKISGGNVNSVGGLVGCTYMANSLYIKDCWVNNSEIHSSYGGAGGLVGNADTAIVLTNASVRNSKVWSISNNKVGGLVGIVTSTITVDGCVVENCTVMSSKIVGGLIGFGSGTSSITFTDNVSWVNYTWVNGTAWVGSMVGANQTGILGAVNSKHSMVYNGTGSVFTDYWTVSENAFDSTMPLDAALTAGVGSDIGKDKVAGKDYGYCVYNVNVENAGPGTASATQSSYAAGTTVELTATPNAGYHFDYWTTDNPEVTIVDNKFTMPRSTVTVTAHFSNEPVVIDTLEKYLNIFSTSNIGETTYYIKDGLSSWTIPSLHNGADQLVINYNVTLDFTNFTNGKFAGIQTTGDCVGGLFGNVSIAAEKTLKINGLKMNSLTVASDGSNIGGVIGYLVGAGVDNSNVDRSKLNFTNCNLVNCSINGTAAGTNNVAGLVGLGFDKTALVSVENCKVMQCDIAAAGSAGALFGRCCVNIWNTNVTNSTVEGNTVGGLGGAIPLSKFANCGVENTFISGISHVGGLVGYATNATSTPFMVGCMVKNCVITASENNGAGLIGVAQDASYEEISGCNVVNCTISCAKNAAGMVSQANFVPNASCNNNKVLYSAVNGAKVNLYHAELDCNKYPGQVGCVDTTGSYLNNSVEGVEGLPLISIVKGTDDTSSLPAGATVVTKITSAGTQDNLQKALGYVIAGSPAVFNPAVGSEQPYTGAIKIGAHIVDPYSFAGYTFNGWNLSSADGTNLTNAAGVLLSGVPGYTNATGYWNNVTGTTVSLYANWTVNTTDVTVTGNKAVFGNDNVTAIHSTEENVVQVLLENVSNVADGIVTFTADNTTVVEIPDVAGYNKDEIAVFEIAASSLGTAKINVTVTFANEAIANATKDNIRFFHYNVSVWEPLNSTIANQNGAKVLYTVETDSFSPFGIGIYTPITYTVHFDANGGQGSMADMTFTYDQGQNLTANAFQRYNSNFLYWTYNGTRYTDKQLVQNLTTGNSVTMVAQWETYSTGGSSSGSTYMGSNSASYTPTQQPTVKPTVAPTAAPTEKPATPTVIATEKPTTQATQQSPAPFVGLLAGLGAAAVLLSNRRK